MKIKNLKIVSIALLLVIVGIFYSQIIFHSQNNGEKVAMPKHCLSHIGLGMMDEKANILEPKALTKFEKKSKERLDELGRIRTEGYGTFDRIKVSESNPHIKATTEALRTETHPERVSILVSPKPFDAKNWASNKGSYKKDYLSVVEPARVFQSSTNPKAKNIKAISEYYQEIEQNSGMAELTVQAEPGSPVSAYAFDGGEFSNRMVANTVMADASGKATFKFKAGNGVIMDCNIRVSSPQSRGYLKFIVHVKKAKE